MRQFQTQTVIGSLVGTITLGTVFFHYVEGWSWLDSYFFTVVTLSTVGYGELVPVTALGMIGTTVFIFVGLGVFVVAIQQFALFHLSRREEQAERLHAQRDNRPEHGPPAANADDAPPN